MDEKSAKKIYLYLCKPLMKLYFQFLYFILTKLKTCNELLQSVTPIVPEEFDMLTKLFREVMLLYMPEEYVKLNNFSEWDPFDYDAIIPH